VSYTVGAGIWLALDGTYYTGGRMTVDGMEGNDLQKNSCLAVTVARPENESVSVKLYGSTGVPPAPGATSMRADSCCNTAGTEACRAEGLLCHGDEDAALVTLHQEGYGVVVVSLGESVAYLLP
jgi:hypothetical protein